MKNVIKDLSLTTKLDKRVITAIVNHPFKFIRDKVAVKDPRPIRLKYFGVFTLKELRTKKAAYIAKSQLLLSDEYVSGTMAYFKTVDINELLEIISNIMVNKQYKDILLAYKKVVQNI